MTDFSSTPDYFDSREVIERIEDIEAEYVADEDGTFNPDNITDDDDREEYDALIELRDEADGYISDWEYGVTFIRDDEFPAYVEEFVKDCGYLSNDTPEWIAIDWDETADNVRVDYTEFTFRGTTYLAR